MACLLYHTDNAWLMRAVVLPTYQYIIYFHAFIWNRPEEEDPNVREALSMFPKPKSILSSVIQVATSSCRVRVSSAHTFFFIVLMAIVFLRHKMTAFVSSFHDALPLSFLLCKGAGSVQNGRW